MVIPILIQRNRAQEATDDLPEDRGLDCAAWQSLVLLSTPSPSFLQAHIRLNIPDPHGWVWLLLDD